ncbi:MAG: alpha-N-arabinofuranosidase, partial [Acidobacteriota bacterium]
VKAVNYEGERNTLLVRLEGAGVPENAVVTLHTITAALTARASLEHPDAIAPVSRRLEYTRDFSVDLEPYTVAVIEVRRA